MSTTHRYYPRYLSNQGSSNFSTGQSVVLFILLVLDLVKMVLEYYYDNNSQPCRAVYLFLKGTGVAFEPKVVELLKGRFYNIHSA